MSDKTKLMPFLLKFAAINDMTNIQALCTEHIKVLTKMIKWICSIGYLISIISILGRMSDVKIVKGVSTAFQKLKLKYKKI